MSKKEVKKEAKQITEKMYDIIRYPVVTEKTIRGQELSKVAFQVMDDVNKQEIKDAVEAVFKVKVKAVNTVNTKDKAKRFRGKNGVRSGFKKAIVTLVDGQNIDFTTGI